MKIVAESLYPKNNDIFKPKFKGVLLIAAFCLGLFGACGMTVDCNRLETQYDSCLNQLAKQDSVFFTESRLVIETAYSKDLRASCDNAEMQINNIQFINRIKCLSQISGPSCLSAVAFQDALNLCYK